MMLLPGMAVFLLDVWYWTSFKNGQNIFTVLQIDFNYQLVFEYILIYNNLHFVATF